MKPMRYLAFREGVGEALAEANLALLQGEAATAAFRAAGCGGFEDMRHARNLTELPYIGGTGVMSPTVAVSFWRTMLFPSVSSEAMPPTPGKWAKPITLRAAVL